ncbi:FAD binding domain-containing protein [Xylogone sp. PMI_703]|nr:FAD binding domain-containing protein [Xylogone sp. PMI_703]
MDAHKLVVHDVPVLVVGGGPVGMLTAAQLAHHRIQCMLAERNLETTKWPKMDITNCRSMELLRRLNLADGLRNIVSVGVPQNYSLDVIFSTGLGDGGEVITKWDLPCPNDWRARISQQNDGSLPREPYQRCSQAIFEAWLKPVIEANPLVDCHFGLKFESLHETADGVTSLLRNTTTGEHHIVKSKYVIGCDGAGSRVRKSSKMKLTGGPIPAAMYLVHFKSRDLARLQKQGQFWHIYFTNGGVIISQDEVDTFTTHLPISLDEDTDKFDPKEIVYRVLGGHTGPFHIDIDKIMVNNAWRANLAVADDYRSELGRVFLAGDSAHQNIPTGGYGMNMGVGDAYDIGWKVAAVLNGYGGEHLLKSYNDERRSVAFRNVERSGHHFSVIGKYIELVGEGGKLLSTTEEAKNLKKRITEHLQSNDGENKDHGIEMDYRFPDSYVVIKDGSKEKEWNPRNYTPSTTPGSRAPHVYLRDDKTSIFDLYGEDYTIVDFTSSGKVSASFEEVAKSLGIPLKRVHLPSEQHVRSIWERDIVLVRPDGIVSWRSDNQGADTLDAEAIKHVLLVSVGQRATNTEKAKRSTELKAFTSSVGNVDQDTGNFEKMAIFQTGEDYEVPV